MSGRLEAPELDTSPTSIGVQVLPERMFGSKILARSRPDLDQQSSLLVTSFVSYQLKGATQRLAIFEALTAGPGKMQMGFREQVDCARGDIIVANMRDAENWITIDGKDYAMLEWANVIGRLIEEPRPHWMQTADLPESLRALAQTKQRYRVEPVQNYVLIERNDAAMNHYVLPPNMRAKGMVLEDVVLSDGYRSDNEQRNRFPVLYGTLVRKGPGKRYPLWSEELQTAEIVHETCDADVGSVVSFVSTMAHCRFRFGGRDYSVCHARNVHMQLPQPPGPKGFAYGAGGVRLLD